MSGWVDLNKFFCISLIYHLTGFPYLLTTFPRMSGLVDLTIFFFVSHLVDFRSGFWHWKWLPKGSPTRLLAKNFFRILLSWLQNRVLTPKWSPQVVTRSSTSQTKICRYLAKLTSESVLTPEKSPQLTTRLNTSQIFFFVSLLVDIRIGIWPQKVHPKWSPGRVLANNFFRISLSCSQNRVLTP